MSKQGSFTSNSADAGQKAKQEENNKGEAAEGARMAARKQYASMAERAARLEAEGAKIYAKILKKVLENPKRQGEISRRRN